MANDISSKKMFKYIKRLKRAVEMILLNKNKNLNIGTLKHYVYTLVKYEYSEKLYIAIYIIIYKYILKIKDECFSFYKKEIKCKDTFLLENDVNVRKKEIDTKITQNYKYESYFQLNHNLPTKTNKPIKRDNIKTIRELNKEKQISENKKYNQYAIIRKLQYYFEICEEGHLSKNVIDMDTIFLKSYYYTKSLQHFKDILFSECIQNEEKNRYRNEDKRNNMLYDTSENDRDSIYHSVGKVFQKFCFYLFSKEKEFIEKYQCYKTISLHGLRCLILSSLKDKHISNEYEPHEHKLKRNNSLNKNNKNKEKKELFFSSKENYAKRVQDEENLFQENEKLLKKYKNMEYIKKSPFWKDIKNPFFGIQEFSELSSDPFYNHLDIYMNAKEKLHAYAVKDDSSYASNIDVSFKGHCIMTGDEEMKTCGYNNSNNSKSLFGINETKKEKLILIEKIENDIETISNIINLFLKHKISTFSKSFKYIILVICVLISENVRNEIFFYHHLNHLKENNIMFKNLSVLKYIIDENIHRFDDKTMYVLSMLLHILHNYHYTCYFFEEEIIKMKKRLIIRIHEFQPTVNFDYVYKYKHELNCYEKSMELLNNKDKKYKSTLPLIGYRYNTEMDEFTIITFNRTVLKNLHIFYRLLKQMNSPDDEREICLSEKYGSWNLIYVIATLLFEHKHSNKNTNYNKTIETQNAANKEKSNVENNEELNEEDKNWKENDIENSSKNKKEDLCDFCDKNKNQNVYNHKRKLMLIKNIIYLINNTYQINECIFGGVCNFECRRKNLLFLHNIFYVILKQWNNLIINLTQINEIFLYFYSNFINNKMFKTCANLKKFFLYEFKHNDESPFRKNTVTVETEILKKEKKEKEKEEEEEEKESTIEPLKKEKTILNFSCLALFLFNKIILNDPLLQKAIHQYMCCMYVSLYPNRNACYFGIIPFFLNKFLKINYYNQHLQVNFPIFYYVYISNLLNNIIESKSLVVFLDFINQLWRKSALEHTFFDDLKDIYEFRKYIIGKSFTKRHFLQFFKNYKTELINCFKMNKYDIIKKFRLFLKEDFKSFKNMFLLFLGNILAEEFRENLKKKFLFLTNSIERELFSLINDVGADSDSSFIIMKVTNLFNMFMNQEQYSTDNMPTQEKQNSSYNDNFIEQMNTKREMQNEPTKARTDFSLRKKNNIEINIEEEKSNNKKEFYSDSYNKNRNSKKYNYYESYFTKFRKNQTKETTPLSTKKDTLLYECIDYYLFYCLLNDADNFYFLHYIFNLIYIYYKYKYIIIKCFKKDESFLSMLRKTFSIIVNTDAQIPFYFAKFLDFFVKEIQFDNQTSIFGDVVIKKIFFNFDKTLHKFSDIISFLSNESTQNKFSDEEKKKLSFQKNKPERTSTFHLNLKKKDSTSKKEQKKKKKKMYYEDFENSNYFIEVFKRSIILCLFKILQNKNKDILSKFTSINKFSDFYLTIKEEEKKKEQNKEQQWNKNKSEDRLGGGGGGRRRRKRIRRNRKGKKGNWETDTEELYDLSEMSESEDTEEKEEKEEREKKKEKKETDDNSDAFFYPIYRCKNTYEVYFCKKIIKNLFYIFHFIEEKDKVELCYRKFLTKRILNQRKNLYVEKYIIKKFKKIAGEQFVYKMNSLISSDTKNYKRLQDIKFSFKKNCNTIKKCSIYDTNSIGNVSFLRNRPWLFDSIDNVHVGKSINNKIDSYNEKILKIKKGIQLEWKYSCSYGILSFETKNKSYILVVDMCVLAILLLFNGMENNPYIKAKRTITKEMKETIDQQYKEKPKCENNISNGALEKKKSRDSKYDNTNKINLEYICKHTNIKKEIAKKILKALVDKYKLLIKEVKDKGIANNLCNKEERRDCTYYYVNHNFFSRNKTIFITDDDIDVCIYETNKRQPQLYYECTAEGYQIDKQHSVEAYIVKYMKNKKLIEKNKLIKKAINKFRHLSIDSFKVQQTIDRLVELQYLNETKSRFIIYM